MNGHFTSEKVEAKHRAAVRLTKEKKLCRIRDSIAKEVQCKHKRATAQGEKETMVQRQHLKQNGRGAMAVDAGTSTCIDSLRCRRSLSLHTR